MSENITVDEAPVKSKRKVKLWVKIVCIVLAVIVTAVIVLGITFVCVWNDEISTVRSFRHLRGRNDANKEGSVYYMEVEGGFYFDEFLDKGGVSNDTQLIKYITDHITRGLIDMGIGETDIGCSSFTAVTPTGDRLFARNYDFDKTNICLTVCNPGGGRHKSFSSVDLNYIGINVDSDVDGLMNKITCLAAPFTPLDGINDAGVACGIYMSYQGGDGTDGTVATNQTDPEKAEEARQRQLEDEAKEEAKKAKREAELAAERAKLLGWADEMTSFQFGRIMTVLGKQVRVEGTIMPWYQFAQWALQNGWAPHKEENVTSWYGSKWDRKESRPRTEYRLQKGSSYYKVSKTVFDFASYLAGKGFCNSHPPESGSTVTEPPDHKN